TLLNMGQGLIMALGLGAVLWLTAIGVADGRFSVGLFSVANAILIHLYQPLEVQDKPGAPELKVTGGEIRFDNVVFAYEPARTVLKGISFVVPAGKTVAVVGPSGAGKSTISRILYRFYDIKSGSVTIDGQDIRDVTQASLRRAIGIVPQDTVLFNDT